MVTSSPTMTVPLRTDEHGKIRDMQANAPLSRKRSGRACEPPKYSRSAT